MIKETEDDSKKWEDIPCSWIGRIYTVKMAILCMTDSRSIHISTNDPTLFLFMAE